MKRYEVWYAIPSASHLRASVCLAKWKSRGYKTAVLVDGNTRAPACVDHYIDVTNYPGYWVASNALCMALQSADIVVCGGDDVYPDPGANPQSVADQFFKRFPDGFGVMQPTGDDLDGTDRICGSPWFGKGWLREGYGGRGPFWPEYMAFYGDEDLFNVAKKLGVLWQRPDLTQYHDHWIRTGGPEKTPYQIKNDRYWEADKAIFQRRKATGFPGHARSTG